MNKSLSLGSSLLVTVVGMVIVFFGLTVLIFLIKALVKATSGIGKKQVKPAAPAPIPAPAPAPVAAAEEPEDDGALIAAITAAIACMMDDGAAFTVRHVRRLSTAPAWQKAGREEQVYSHS